MLTLHQRKCSWSSIDVTHNVANYIPTMLISPGLPPNSDVPFDTYPINVISDHDSDFVVPVIHPYDFGKYLGRLDVTFDDDGNLIQYSGNPILLDNSVDQGRET